MLIQIIIKILKLFQISDDDEFCKYICLTCINNIDKAFTFRLKCIESDKILKSGKIIKASNILNHDQLNSNDDIEENTILINKFNSELEDECIFEINTPIVNKSDISDQSDNEENLKDTLNVNVDQSINIGNEELSFKRGRTLTDKTHKFKCNKCSKVFLKQKTLETHMEKHLKPGFRCNLCEGSFLTAGGLREHLKRSFHKNASSSEVCLYFS